MGMSYLSCVTSLSISVAQKRQDPPLAGVWRSGFPGELMIEIKQCSQVELAVYERGLCNPPHEISEFIFVRKLVGLLDTDAVSIKQKYAVCLV